MNKQNYGSKRPSLDDMSPYVTKKQSVYLSVYSHDLLAMEWDLIPYTDSNSCILSW